MRHNIKVIEKITSIKEKKNPVAITSIKEKKKQDKNGT